MARRKELFEELQPLVTDVRRPPVGLGGSTEAGDAHPHERRPDSRWNAGKDLSFTPLRPERVVEVRYDHMEGMPLPAHRPVRPVARGPRPPSSCTYDQLEEPVSYDLADVLAPTRTAADEQSGAAAAVGAGGDRGAAVAATGSGVSAGRRGGLRSPVGSSRRTGRRPDDVARRATSATSVVTSALTPRRSCPVATGCGSTAASGTSGSATSSSVDDDARHGPRASCSASTAATSRPDPARWNRLLLSPPPDAALGVPTEHVTYPTELGPMPAWVVDPAEARPGERWAVLVHGRGARREECLRAVKPLLRRGS